MVDFKGIYEKYDGRYGDLVQAYIELDKEKNWLSKRISRMEREAREQENEVRGLRENHKK